MSTKLLLCFLLLTWIIPANGQNRITLHLNQGMSISEFPQLEYQEVDKNLFEVNRRPILSAATGFELERSIKPPFTVWTQLSFCRTGFTEDRKKHIVKHSILKPGIYQFRTEVQLTSMNVLCGIDYQIDELKGKPKIGIGFSQSIALEGEASISSTFSDEVNVVRGSGNSFDLLDNTQTHKTAKGRTTNLVLRASRTIRTGYSVSLSYAVPLINDEFIIPVNKATNYYQSQLAVWLSYQLNNVRKHHTNRTSKLAVLSYSFSQMKRIDQRDDVPFHMGFAVSHTIPSKSGLFRIVEIGSRQSQSRKRTIWVITPRFKQFFSREYRTDNASDFALRIGKEVISDDPIFAGGSVGIRFTYLMSKTIQTPDINGNQVRMGVTQFMAGPDINMYMRYHLDKLFFTKASFTVTRYLNSTGSINVQSEIGVGFYFRAQRDD